MTVKILKDDESTEYLGTGRGFQKHMLIAALGNPLRGDDGVGPAIIQTLNNEYYLGDNVTCCELTGNRLLSVLTDSEFDRVIIMDAANFKATPGEWIRLDVKDVDFNILNFDDSISLHHLNLPEIIALLTTLNHHIPEMIIFGIQPQDMDYSDELSEAVKATIQPLSRIIRDEVLAFTAT
jgi:hydrogenase maturation protease